MDGESSQVERGKAGGRGKKKRRGGTKFSDSKSLPPSSRILERTLSSGVLAAIRAMF